MAKVKLEEKTLTDIGKAIRTKTGGTSLYLPAEMPSAILGITSPGGTSDATLSSGRQMLSGVTAYAKGIKYTGTMRTYIGQVDGTQGHVGSYTTYSGFYNVTPSTTPQVLSTSNCILLSDIHIASYPSEPATPVLSSLVALSNGSYAPPSGVDGFDSVVVDVAAEVIEPTLSDIEFVSNGTYFASDNNCDGFSVVSVAVPQTSLISSVFTGNGHFTAEEGYAFDDVTVSVPALSIGTLSVSSNGFYYGGQFDAYSEITVEVPEPSMSTLEVTSNGTYAAADLELDGFTDVTVSVPENSATFMHKIISTSGVYIAADDEVSGYSQVTVTVPAPSLSMKTFSEDGVYSASAYGVNGWSRVTVSVASKLKSCHILADGVYRASDYDIVGWKEIVVSVMSGYNVSFIADNAFNGDVTLVSANFPSASTIGNGAFANCVNLETASFPVCETMGHDAFANCVQLSEAYLPQCTNIESWAFAHCSNLQNLTIGTSCSAVGAWAFVGCESLTGVALPNCTAIGSNAFADCSNLSYVDLPKCQVIGSRAFRPIATEYGSVVNIYLPSCTTIYEEAFWHDVRVYLTGDVVVDLKSTDAFPDASSAYQTWDMVYVPESLYDSYLSHSVWRLMSGFIRSIGG